MDQDRKKLKREYARLVSKLERVLKRYAPIDPSDEDSIGDEYDPLAPPLVSMLMRGCSREELFRAIESFRARYWKSVTPIPSWTGKSRTLCRKPSPQKTRSNAQDRPSNPNRSSALIFARIGKTYSLTSRNKCGCSNKPLKLTWRSRGMCLTSMRLRMFTSRLGYGLL